MTHLDDKWEDSTLGRDENFVQKTSRTKDSLENALGLQPISIRLPKALIQDLKNIAELHGLGYQPLIKQILNRFVDAEKRMMANEKIAEELKKIKLTEEQKQHKSKQKKWLKIIPSKANLFSFFYGIGKIGKITVRKIILTYI
ncbi:hypothetical protein [Pasteurella multocida]|uniref:hypothetical protein n=1 Tax=Pasteurella multocida TaxID=747 RepID=UPI00210020B8|nr:hypothetical protein [Pasteurella multocida]MDY0631545.1 hypothetical protein [Pasteurella multocida]